MMISGRISRNTSYPSSIRAITPRAKFSTTKSQCAAPTLGYRHRLGHFKVQADAAFALIPLIEAACTVASYQPVRKRRNHTVDIEPAHAFYPKYLGTQMTELEHAEKLTGESGALPAFNRAHQAHSASGCRTDAQAGGERRTKSA